MFEHWVPSEWRCLGRFSVCGPLEEVYHWGGGGVSESKKLCRLPFPSLFLCFMIANAQLSAPAAMSACSHVPHHGRLLALLKL